ncbi:MAG TPA: hypothetical protein VF582_01355 [Allosphingosinicella sp.]
MRKLTLILSLLAAGCDSTQESAPDEQDIQTANRAHPISLTTLERNAKQRLDAKYEASKKSAELKAKVQKAMAAYLFDPGSAQYMSLRAGRKGAVCGKYNAKNRYGAYIGYKDFVLSGDGDTIFGSDYNNGIRSALYGSFAEAYLNACATEKEAKAHAQATAVDVDVEPTSDDPFVDL